MSWQADVLAAMQEVAAAIVDDKMVVDVGAAVVNVDLATVDVDAIVDGIAGSSPSTLADLDDALNYSGYGVAYHAYNTASNTSSTASNTSNISAALYSGNGYALQDYFYSSNDYEPFFYNGSSLAYLLYNIDSYMSTLYGCVSGGRLLTSPDYY